MPRGRHYPSGEYRGAAELAMFRCSSGMEQRGDIRAPAPGGGALDSDSPMPTCLAGRRAVDRDQRAAFSQASDA